MRRDKYGRVTGEALSKKVVSASGELKQPMCSDDSDEMDVASCSVLDGEKAAYRRCVKRQWGAVAVPLSSLRRFSSSPTAFCFMSSPRELRSA